MYEDASLLDGKRNKVVKVRTFLYFISYRSDVAPLPPYLAKGSILPNEFLTPVACLQCKTTFENSFFLKLTFWNYS